LPIFTTGGDILGREIDDALPALADHLETVVRGPDIAANQGRLEFHDHVPAHGHDVGLVLVSRADQNDRPRLDEAANVIDRKILLGVFCHGRYISLLPASPLLTSPRKNGAREKRT
jgi:hypothetical protein